MTKTLKVEISCDHQLYWELKKLTFEFYFPFAKEPEKWEVQSVESGYHSPDYPHLQFEYDDIFDDICL